jgi:hypothetical protein
MDLSDYVTMYGTKKDMCYEDMCNQVTDQAGFTCMGGSVTTDLDMMVLYDDTKEVACGYEETQCYMQSLDIVHADWQVQWTTGGCYSDQYKDMVDAGIDMMNKFMKEGASISSYNFDTCNETNCFDFTPENSNPTLKCNTGLKVTDQETGEIVFSYH